MKRRYFDLPANITYSSGKSAAYIYDANGYCEPVTRPLPRRRQSRRIIAGI